MAQSRGVTVQVDELCGNVYQLEGDEILPGNPFQD